MKIYYLLIFLSLISLSVDAQDYNYPESAIEIVHQNGWSSGGEVYSTKGTTNEGPACYLNRWFKFTATDTYIEIIFNSANDRFLWFTLLDGLTTTLIDCSRKTTNSSYIFDELEIGKEYYFSVGHDNATKGTFGFSISGGAFQGYWNESNGVLHPKIIENQVAVGTSSLPEGYLFAVDGKAIMEEVKVQLSESWPDFVFKSEYRLRTLKEVKEHITENGHLPEIPSEAEVSENGINLGEMNAKLLQKIEELTLYLIEQNKQNQAQQSKIELLEEKISQLENK